MQKTSEDHHSYLDSQRINMIKIALLVSFNNFLQPFPQLFHLYLQVCSAALVAADADALYGAYGYGGHLGMLVTMVWDILAMV